MTEFVLCATQRCGSTMIVEDMRNSRCLGQPEEWFIPWTPERTGTDWPAELARVRAWGTGPDGVFAVKVMASQLAGIDACLSGVVPDPAPSEAPFARFHALFRGAVWVWLTRRDLVGQAVSRVMSQQTGVNHATGGEDHFAGNLMQGGDLAGYNATVSYSYEAILRECTAITLETLAWQRFFEAHGITPLCFAYEDTAQDAEMRHLDALAAAGAVPGTPAKTRRRLLRMANARNAAFVRRFHAEAAQRGFR